MSTLTETMVLQIGRTNILAVSGGRVIHDSDNMRIVLPVRYGYRVVVTYDRPDDTYIVERIFQRGGKNFPKGTERGVHCDQLGDSVYRASCYVNVDFGGVPVR